MIPLARRRGLALPFVLVCAAMILGTWGLANRQTVAVVMLKEHIQKREQDAMDSRGRRLALAYGLALLQSGQPKIPSGQTTYVCRAVLQVTGGANQTYVLTFTRTQAGVWTVASRALLSTDDPNLPQPTSFPSS
jgi:hypothetical protein